MRCNYCKLCRNYKHGTIVILLLLLSLSKLIVAQENIYKSLHFDYITTKEGLAQNSVDDILMDSYGYMWFATWNGLCRYDGYLFETLKSDTLSYGMQSNFVKAIYEDQYHRLWIGTARGISVYNLATRGFENINITGIDLTYSTINAIYIDNNYIYLGTDSNGLIVLKENGKNFFNLFAQFNTNARTIFSNEVNCISKHDDNYLMIGTQQGSYIINPNSVTVDELNNWSETTKSFEVLTIYTDSKNTVWVGSRDGLHRFSSNLRLEQSFYHSGISPDVLPHNTINDIVEDGNNQLIIGTLNGICIYNRETQDFTNPIGNKLTHNSLNNEFVNSLSADQKGNVWIGTEKGGINYFNIYQTHFKSIISDPDDLNSLSHPTIDAIYIDKDYIWVGTAGGGLNRINKENNKFRHYRKDPSNNQSINLDFVSSMTRDSSGKLWVSTWGGGISKMQSPNGVFKRFYSSESSFSSNYVATLFADKRNFLLVGTENGLDILNPKTEKFIRLNEGLSKKEFSDVGAILNDGTHYWIGTRKGLYQFPIDKISNNSSELIDEDIVLFKSDIDDPNSLPIDFVTTLLKSKDGTIWGGTYGSGIFKIEKDSTGNYQFFNFSSIDGLENNIVYRIEEDNTSCIWISTDNGLTRFNPETEIFINYFENDGLLNNQFYWTASYKDTDGTIYFGGINGINYFNPQMINDYPFENEVFITDVKIFHESVKPYDVLDNIEVLNRPLNNLDTIKLSYKHNVFSIEFSSLNYLQTEKIRYEYKLEKVDNDWVKVNHQRRYASYTNLKGGSYNFMLRCLNSDGSISKNTKSITIIIKPPFYQSNWFQILVLISVIATVFILLRNQMLGLINQKNQLKAQVDDRTKKIEEQKQELIIQANNLKENNLKLEQRQSLIEGQKQKLENANIEISKQRDQLIELNTQIEEVSQSKLRFFTNISHEFRTPLTLILDPIENLLQKFKADNDTVQTLKIIQRNAQRLLTLVNQLMYFRRIENGKFTIKVAKGNLSEYIQEIHNTFIDLASNQKILFEYERPAKSVEVYFDPDKVENLIYNLLSNAFKFTPQGGKITILLDYFKKEGHSWVRIKVSDTGIGIEEDQIEHIFDRFYQVDQNNSYQGSGIGLALSKGIVEAFKGTISLSSETNKGSEFTIELPADKNFFPEDQISEQPIGLVTDSVIHHVNAIKTIIQHPNDPEKLKIENQDRSLPLLLIVEDNYDLRNFLLFSLQNNYRVLEAANGKIGLELANKHTPDLIISDVMMPEMDGIEMCTQVKRNIQTSHIPIILLTAKALVENWVEGLEIGADDYIPKPFNLTILNARVQNLIDSRKRIIKQFSKELFPDIERVSTSTLDEEFLQKTYNILEKHYTTPDFSVEDFAKEMCISKSLLYKKLKVLSDMSITDFINSYKIKKSLPLLKEGRLNVADVAFNVGYNDPKYFSRVFRKFMGMAPSNYS